MNRMKLAAIGAAMAGAAGFGAVAASVLGNGTIFAGQIFDIIAGISAMPNEYGHRVGRPKRP